MLRYLLVKGLHMKIWNMTDLMFRYISTKMIKSLAAWSWQCLAQCHWSQGARVWVAWAAAGTIWMEAILLAGYKNILHMHYAALYMCTYHCTALYTVHTALYRARCQSWPAHRPGSSRTGMEWSGHSHRSNTQYRHGLRHSQGGLGTIL